MGIKFKYQIDKYYIKEAANELFSEGYDIEVRSQADLKFAPV